MRFTLLIFNMIVPNSVEVPTDDAACVPAYIVTKDVKKLVVNTYLLPSSRK